MAEKRVVGVYRDDAAADRAIGLAEEAGARHVVRGGRADYIASLQDEQREEMEHTFVGPGNFGPFTKEMSKGIAAWTPALTVGLMVVAVPIAFLEFGRLGFMTRLAIVEAAALFTGATVGFIAGMMLGKKGEGDHGIDRREDPLAAEAGVVVGATVEEWQVERVADAMASADPVRLDVSGMHGEPLSTLGTEEDPR
jgi:hypothetical protein